MVYEAAIIDHPIPIGRSCQRTQDDEEDDLLRSGECEKCEWEYGKGQGVEENEKEEKTPADEDGGRVEGKER